MNKKQQIESAQHGQPRPRIRSAYSIVLRVSAILLALSAFSLPYVLAQLGTDSAVGAILIVVEMMSILFLVIAALFRHGEKRTIPVILTDQRTVHWTYAPEEWRRFTTQAWQRSLRLLLIPTAICGALLVLSIVFYFVNTQGALDGLEFTAIFLCSIVGAVLLRLFLNAVRIAKINCRTLPRGLPR